jgi:hypothetical protein
MTVVDAMKLVLKGTIRVPGVRRCGRPIGVVRGQAFEAQAFELSAQAGSMAARAGGRLSTPGYAVFAPKSAWLQNP